MKFQDFMSIPNPRFEYFKQENPKLWLACNPRTIHTPNAYTNPKFFNKFCFNVLVMYDNERGPNYGVHVWSFMNAVGLVEYGFPTYFVGNEFGLAVSKTKIPTSHKFKNVNIPIPAMIFCLPEDLSFHLFGANIPYIAFSCFNQGNYPKQDGKLINNTEYDIGQLITIQDTEIFITYFVEGKESPCLYGVQIGPQDDIEIICDQEIEDTSLRDAELFGIPLKTNEIDFGFVEKKAQALLVRFILQILLALNARPELLETEKIAQKIRRKGKIVNEIWSPNMIGFKYHIERPNNPLKGTHASPRMHWRIGHFRNQVFGEQFSQHKIIWIDPTLINAE